MAALHDARRPDHQHAAGQPAASPEQRGAGGGAALSAPRLDCGGSGGNRQRHSAQATRKSLRRLRSDLAVLRSDVVGKPSGRAAVNVQRQVGDDEMDVGAHQPDRPSWLCLADGEEFPCAAMRAHVRRAFRNTIDRGIYMGGFYQFAIIELPRPEEAGAIHRRFFEWTREPVASSPPRGTPPGGIF
jgi:hypothetical protein